MVPRFYRVSTGGRQSGAVSFDAGRLTFDGGLLVVAEIEHHLESSSAWRALEDRDAARVRRGLAMITSRLVGRGRLHGCQRLDALRADPAFQIAVGRLPERRRLVLPATMCRLRTCPTNSSKRMMAAMVGLFCDSSTTCRGGSSSTSTIPRIGSPPAAGTVPCPFQRQFLPDPRLRGGQRQPVAVIVRPGRRRAVPKLPWCCATSSRPSAPPGREWRSWCAATALRSARGRDVVRAHPCATSSASPAPRSCSPGSPIWPGRGARPVAGESDEVRRYGEFRYAARMAGRAPCGGPVEASPAAATPASSSPTSPARRAGCTRTSTAARRQKT